MSLPTLFFLFFALPSLAAGTFSFTTTSAATQCDNIGISWTGGSGAGYYLSIIPEFGVPRNISIPSTNLTGTFETILPLNVSDKFVLTLSDSTGFGAGGSSSLLTVGQSLGGNCDLTLPPLPFVFSINGALQQCLPFPFTDYSAAVQPVKIIGVIPGGDSFVINVPVGQSSFQWTANVFNGTQIIFLMVDAKGQQGGSVLDTVQVSGDSSCINDQSPSVTAAPSSTSTPSSTSSSAPSTSSSSVPATPRSSVGAIAGSVLGAILVLAVLITLGLFFLRQRQEKKNARLAGGSEFRRTSRPMNSALDLTDDAHQTPYMSASGTPSTSAFNQHPSFQQGPPGPPAHYQPHSGYLLPESENPFNAASQTASRSTHDYNADVDPFMERGGSESVSASRRKSGMSGFTAYRPSRYVVHTDAEDEDLRPNEDGVIELPPQYSASRAPSKGLPQSDSFDHPPL